MSERPPGTPRRRVLHVLHDFLPRHRAGSELYVAALCRELADDVDVEVLCTDFDLTAPPLALRWRDVAGLPVVELNHRLARADSGPRFPAAGFADTWRSPAVAEVLAHVLSMLRPDLLHVHSLTHLAFTLPSLAQARGIPSVATLHDFALVCAAGGQRVSHADGARCDVIDPERCRHCVPRAPITAPLRLAAAPLPLRAAAAVAVPLARRLPSFGRLARRALAGLPAPAPLPAGEIEARLGGARGVFDTVSRFVAPSHALADDYVRFGLPRDKLEVSPLGHPPLHTTRIERAAGAPLRLGFVGTLVEHKGVHVAIEALRALPPGACELVVHGSLDVFPDYVERLRRAAAELPVRFAGSFDDAARGRIYGALDALVVPSLWPENAPLVVEEAFACGVPVVASRIGGLPERVVDGVGGLLVEPGSADSLARALRRLHEEPELRERLAGGVPTVRTIADDAARWRERYEQVLAAARSAA